MIFPPVMRLPRDDVKVTASRVPILVYAARLVLRSFSDPGIALPWWRIAGYRSLGRKIAWRAAVFKTQYLCWLCLLFAAGCRLFPVNLPQDKESPQNSGETITITRSSGSSTPGTTHTHSTWGFRPTGECRYLNTSQMVARDFPPSKSESQWQSKTDYERCSNLLRKTRFFQTREKDGEILPGGSYTCLEVVRGTKKHQISFRSNQAPNGISPLMSFLDTCASEAESKPQRKK